ncbi:hypothetical protein BSKO_00868 [Bryopsis sp. KO-2023]|nr:hypothetical protein BSKO_00868 [Bryopsis sp. KO-2023]
MLSSAEAPVADYLTREFKDVAKLLLDRAVTQHFCIGSETARKDKLLKSLRLVGRSDAISIFQSLWAWRVKWLKNGADTIIPQSKKEVVVESTFLEATLQLLEDKPYLCSEVMGDCTGKVEKMAFDWAMKCDQYLASSENQRRHIFNVTGRLIKSMAGGRLEAIAAIFFKELEGRINSELSTIRQEILSLCSAMKHIHLSFDTDNDMAAAVNFLEHANPLKHVAPFKKSQVHHALANMLSTILRALVVRDIPRSCIDRNRGLREKWFKQISFIRGRVLEWSLKKSKHIADGYPLIVDLWCLEDDKSFAQHGDKVVKTMLKALKQKETRTLAVRCLIQCVQVWLSRYFQKTDNRRGCEDWLSKITKTVITNAKKGHLGSPELQDMTVLLCVTIGEYAPKFALEKIIYEFMHYYEYWDCVTVGLRSLLELMLMEVARQKRSKIKNAPLVFRTRNQLVTLEQHELEPQLLHYISTGHHTMELLNLQGCVSRLTSDLRKLLSSCQSMFGSMIVSARSSAGDNTKDVVTGLNVFAWGVRLIPYLVPDGWHDGKLAEVLPQYTSHVEHMVSGVAFRALSNVLMGIPSLRNSVIMGMVNFVLSLSDESFQSILDGLKNLIQLLKEWYALAINPMYPATPTNVSLNIHRLEGAGLCFMCSTERMVRTFAVKLLVLGRELDKAIKKKQAMQAQHESDAGESVTPTKVTTPNAWGSVGTETMVYVADMLDEMGSDIVARCYWDFGDWSDLWRRWRPVPEGVSIADVLRCDGDPSVASIRWSRCLSEIAKEASVLCQSSVHSAYADVSNKMMRLTKLDSSGRRTLSVEINDTRTLDVLRNYSAFACGCPPLKKSGSREGVIPASNLFQLLLNPLHGGALLPHQQSTIMSLGHCNPDCYGTLAKDIKPLVEQTRTHSSMKQKTKVKLEEVRLNVANIMRIISDSMPRGILKNQAVLRKRLIGFLDSTSVYLQHQAPKGIYDYICNSAPDSMADIHQLCYCLCIVAANAGPELTLASTEGLHIDLRRLLFKMFSQWCSPGAIPGQYDQDMDRLRDTVRGRLKDPESRGRVFDELYQSCAHLAHAARMGMVAMLQGPVFDNDKRLSVPISTWIEHLLTSSDKGINPCGPSKVVIARQALLKLLLSNLVLFDVYVDRCYSRDPEIAAVYFQAVCEVYCSVKVSCPIQNILSLVLYKCVDSKPEVREDALHLLKVLSLREWQGKATTGWSIGVDNDMESDAVIIGSLQDSCQNFQYQLSEGLVREHPEVNEQLCEELMTRQLDGVNQGVLVALTPWMEQLSFSPGDCEWGDRLLKAMYYITHEHGSQFNYEVEKLWSTIAGNERNVRPTLDFLVDFGVKECANQDVESLLQYFSVLKRVSLYLARAAPTETIDLLVSESSQMIQALDHGVDEEEVRDALAITFSGLGHRSGSITPESGYGLLRDPSMGDSMYSIGKLRESRDAPLETSMHMPSRSMHSDGSIEGSQLSVKSEHLTQALKRSPSNASGIFGNERRGSEVVAPSLKGLLLQRSELSVCLLAELAFEQGGKFTEHVPLLFHISVICMDSPEPVVRLHCQELVVNLLHSLNARKTPITGSSRTRLGKLSSLMNSLKAMKGQPLWPYEDVDLREGKLCSEESLRNFVLSLREHMDPAMLDQWTQEALTWSVESRSRHLACRSLQVLRALCPDPSSELFINLLCCLRECFKSSSATARECALEIMATLKVLMDKVEPSKLVLYPQLFWVAIVILSSDYVHLYLCAAKLMHLGLSCLNMTNENILNVLLATTPGSANNSPVQSPGSNPAVHQIRLIPPWTLGSQALLGTGDSCPSPLNVLCIQQLLLRGFWSAKTECLTIQLLTLLARHLGQPNDHFSPLDSTGFEGLSRLTNANPFRSGISSLLGGIRNQISVTFVGVVPWVIMQIGGGKQRDLVGEVCSAVAEACTAEGWAMLGAAMSDLGTADAGTVYPILARLSDAVHEDMPPQYQCLVLGYWLALLQRDSAYVKVGLLLLGSIFTRCWQNLERGQIKQTVAITHVASDAYVFSVISAHLRGNLSQEAREVLSTMVACSSAVAGQKRPQEELTEALGMGFHLHKRVPISPDQTRGAITGILETCPKHSRESSRREFMPFI